MNPALADFYKKLNETAEKLKKHKGNDMNSLLQLKNRITRGGNDFNNWHDDFRSKFCYSLPDSLIYEYIMCLYSNHLVTNKPPRETNRYKYVLYAWIQNDWAEYGPLFNRTMFVIPQLTSANLTFHKSIDQVYQEVTEKLFKNTIDPNDAADQLAYIETIRAIVITTQILKKKHKVINCQVYKKPDFMTSAFDQKDQNWGELTFLDPADFFSTWPAEVVECIPF